MNYLVNELAYTVKRIEGVKEQIKLSMERIYSEVAERKFLLQIYTIWNKLFDILKQIRRNESERKFGDDP